VKVRRVRAASRFAPRSQGDQTRTEEHGEDPALGAFEDHVGDDPGPEVRPGGSAEVGGIISEGHPEEGDVHEEDAEESDPANGVETLEPPGFG